MDAVDDPSSQKGLREDCFKPQKGLGSKVGCGVPLLLLVFGCVGAMAFGATFEDRVTEEVYAWMFAPIFGFLALSFAASGGLMLVDFLRKNGPAAPRVAIRAWATFAPPIFVATLVKWVAEGKGVSTMDFVLGLPFATLGVALSLMVLVWLAWQVFHHFPCLHGPEDEGAEPVSLAAPLWYRLIPPAFFLHFGVGFFLAGGTRFDSLIGVAGGIFGASLLARVYRTRQRTLDE